MGWAIMLEGRTDQAAILLLFDDREEAEDIAFEVRRRGHPVVVHPFAGRGPDTEAGQPLAALSTPPPAGG
jgi:hypothetical protein